MKKLKKISIIGVGLLGGSIGMAVKKKNLAEKVVGFFRHKKKIEAALQANAIDMATLDFDEAIKDSDLIILSSPVSDILARLKQIKKTAFKDTLITDTGSTKEKIVKEADGLNFIGSHPLAGSEQSGLQFASPGLFSGSICILTPNNNKNKTSVKRITEFWNELGCQTITMLPKSHDRILAFTSHLPHAIAFSLIKSIPQKMLKCSAGGIKDTTRIALSNPDIWLDIFLSNRDCVLRSIGALEKSLAEFKNALKAKDRQKLLSFLKTAQNKRKNIVQKL